MNPAEHTPARRPWLALALTVPFPTLGTCAAFWWWPGAVGTALYFIAKAWIYTLPLWWTPLIDGNRWSWSPMRRGGLRLALATGLGILALILGAWFLLGPYVVDVAAMRATAAEAGLDSTWPYLGLAGYLITVNSISEEYLFRWFIYRQLAAHLTMGQAVLGSALVFAVHHWAALYLQSGWVLATVGALGTFVGGAIWSWLYARTRSIWPGYLSHALADVGVFAAGWLILFG